MNELYELINRFQKIADKTGRSKTSSFYVDLHFSPHFTEDDKVTINMGGYDIGEWNRHHTVESTGKTLIDDLREIVESAEQETAESLEEDGYIPHPNILIDSLLKVEARKKKYRRQTEEGHMKFGVKT